MVYRLLRGCLYYVDDGKMPRKTVEVHEPRPLTQTTTRVMLGSNPTESERLSPTCEQQSDPGRGDQASMEPANAITQLQKPCQEELNSKKPSYLLSESESTTLICKDLCMSLASKSANLYAAIQLPFASSKVRMQNLDCYMTTQNS